MTTAPASMRGMYPRHTWAGLAILVTGQILLAMGSSFMAIWLTPIMWTGIILLLDGVVYRLRGRSWLMNRRREFPLLVLASVAVWLLFEAYNLRLINWLYRGLPASAIVRDIGYFWSFATIMPGVFEAADIMLALLERSGLAERLSRIRIPLCPAWLWTLAGIAMVTIPLALPAWIGAYLFAFVWIGFIVLIDPLNQRLGVPSIRAQLSNGYAHETAALLIGGLLCGFLWETWNQQAYRAGGAYWIYTFPEPLHIFGWKFGQMPVLGLLGFPPFALELFAFYQLSREILGGERIFGPAPAER